jgi:hypothetical protein
MSTLDAIGLAIGRSISSTKSSDRPFHAITPKPTSKVFVPLSLSKL